MQSLVQSLQNSAPSRSADIWAWQMLHRVANNRFGETAPQRRQGLQMSASGRSYYISNLSCAAHRIGCQPRMDLVQRHVPFCGHAVLKELTGSATRAPDLIHSCITVQQPDARIQSLQSDIVRDLAAL